MSSNLPAVIGTLLKAIVAGSTSDSADFWKIETWSVEDLTAGSFE
ncbi:hypothetical protein [Tomitella gaofuii]|nr:hypothetical protein [Tomitella gaofuii]